LAPPGVEVVDAPIDGPLAAPLVAALETYLSGIYGLELPIPYDAGLYEIFVVAVDGGAPVGCGGLIRFDDRSAEVKRMYVAPEARGRGIGRLVLAELEARAARAGYERIVLETGDLQTEAIALYRSAGYTDIPRYPPYENSPWSVCLARDMLAS
jgi:GNAT superfamily N-acetyltransferase